MFYQFFTVLALASCLMLTPCSNAFGATEFIGQGVIPGSATDTLGLTNPMDAAGTPQNLMGGFGSAIAYSGFGNTYIATPDRGPADGDNIYLDRFYRLNIDLNPARKTVTPSLVSTFLLSKGSAYPGQIFTGSSVAFDAGNSPASLRFDPEGVRMGRNSTVFISDEYGPFVYEFDKYGSRLRSLTIPEKFLIDKPSAKASEELDPSNNSKGRQVNRGMEGLAINPAGTKLYGMMQNALIQDNALDNDLKRVGKNNRLLEIELATGNTREFLYQLDSKSNGVNEILAINDHEFLVLERDGKAGVEAAFKKIFKIDISSASDISYVPNLPEKTIPVGETAVTKSLFLDLLDPAFGLVGANFPEKIEGIAFGPYLPDGRISLLVTSDNDFNLNNPSIIYAFAIDAGDLNYVPQVITPVPGTIIMLGSGLAGILIGRRRLKADLI